MEFYAVTNTGEQVDFTDTGDEDSDYIAEKIMLALVTGADWVQLHLDHGDEKLTTRWTVMERDSCNMPVQIASEEFDGVTEIIENDWFPEQREGGLRDV